MVLCGKPANKCAWEKRKSPPGDRSVLSQRRRPSEYGMQLKEKQKVKGVKDDIMRIEYRMLKRRKCRDDLPLKLLNLSSIIGIHSLISILKR